MLAFKLALANMGGNRGHVRGHVRGRQSWAECGRNVGMIVGVIVTLKLATVWLSSSRPYGGSDHSTITLGFSDFSAKFCLLCQSLANTR